jgi:putative ABC transport system permease protein
MGMQLARGRDFDQRDTESAPRIAMVNETMARALWAEQDALGKRFRLSGADAPWMTVVGVIKDVKQRNWAAPTAKEMYIPYLQDAAYLHDPMSFLSMTLVVRTATAPAAVLPLIREQIRAIDRNVPIAAITPMEQVVSDAIWQPRLAMSLLSWLAGLALLLAAVGIYAVMSYIVSGRTQEIGIRIALGASQADVQLMVLAQSLRPVAAGVVLGLAGAFALTRLMSSLLFETSATDPGILIAVTILLVAAALLAGALPARKAARIDPLIALR